MVKIGKYDVKPTAVGIIVYFNGNWAGSIDGVSVDTVHEEMIDELLNDEDYG